MFVRWTNKFYNDPIANCVKMTVASAKELSNTINRPFKREILRAIDV